MSTSAGTQSRFRLDGKVALVTGGTRGIGRSVVRTLADAGATVLFCGRNERLGKATAASASASGPQVEFRRADITVASEVDGLVGACMTLFGKIDILVNNAGPTDLLHERGVDGPVTRISAANWDRIVTTTLTSVFLMTKYSLRPMVAAGSGAIVNMSSVAGGIGVPGVDAYSAAKSGCEALTRSVATGYAHLGIRCNCIRIGKIFVPRGEDADDPNYVSPGPTPPLVGEADWIRPAPPPEGLPQHIADATLFLASDEASYITGIVLPVDGGLTARSLMPWPTERPAIDDWAPDWPLTTDTEG